jgi:hypothetical protein
MKRKWLIAPAALIPLGLIALSLLSLPEPDYEVIADGDGYELRRYQPMVVAETDVDADFAGASAPAYERLVGYLQRGNAGGRNLPMMAPVIQQPIHQSSGPSTGQPAIQQASQPIRPPQGANASPASQTDPGRWRVQFVMAKEYPMSYLPAPVDDRVQLRRLPERLVAARRYGGGWSASRYRAEEAALQQRLADARLSPIGAPGFARYNAPFVPGFLRRNEVLIEVDDAGLSEDALTD